MRDKLRGGVLAGIALVSMASETLYAVRITEIMYHPAGSVEAGAPDLEYIEIFNEETNSLDLLGYHFCGGVRYTFTAESFADVEERFLDPGEYLVIAADPEAIKQAYGIDNVVGPWGEDRDGEAQGAALDNGGERIELCDNAGVLRAGVDYNDRGKWPGGADGTGHSLEIEYIYGEQDDPDNWNVSGKIGGSPGRENDTETGKLPIVLNELYSMVAGAEERWVELYNRGDTEIDLSGFHLSTDRDNLMRSTLPPDTKIAAGGYLALTESTLGLELAVTAPRERVFVILTSPAGDRVIDARTFRPARVGSSEARSPDGTKTFSETAIPTRAAANRVEVVTDVVINEVHYHPIDDDESKEFVELYNRGDVPVDLTGWSFSAGISFDFPAVTIPAGGYLVVARDPARIRQLYGLGAAQVIGPETDEAVDDFGRLSNAGERLTLSDPLGNTASSVVYRDGGEWPLWADGGGSSLELIDPWQDGRGGQAWDASDDSDRAPITTVEYQGTFNGADESELHLGLSGRGITVIDDISITTRITTVETRTTFVALDDTWRYFKGTQDPPAEWILPSFNDGTWLSGQAIIGFGEDDETTILDDMRRNYLSVFFRKTFELDSLDVLEDPEGLERLIFSIDYDDGYVVWLNGTRVLVTNMRDEDLPGFPTFETRAAASRRQEKTLEDHDVPEWKDLLRQGTNVLAVSVHNSTVSSNDFRFQAQLTTGVFVNQDGDNQLTDGTFEDEDTVRANWTIEGTHAPSGRTTVKPISGVASLKIVSTGNVDNKVNRIETNNRGLARLDRLVDYLVQYKARWVVGTATLLTRGKDQNTLPAAFAHSEQLRLPDRFGTPGGMNSVTRRQMDRVGSTNLGPVIDAVRHEPAVPDADVPVTVRARVADTDGVATVTLHYSLTSPAPAGQATAVAMADPDGDGVYVGELPGQRRGALVVYFITATDTQGESGRFPLDYLSRTHPPVLDPTQPGTNDPRYVVYRHDTPYRGNYHSYRVVMHQGLESYLSSRAMHSNELVDSTFIFGDRDVYHNAGVRFSGSPWARSRWTGSWRVRMPRDAPLHHEMEKFGMEQHQGSGARDGRETISHYMLRFNQGSTPVPYSTQWLVQFQVNGRLNDLREHYYMPGRQFLELWYPDDQDGLFFEMDDRHTISDAGTRQASSDGLLKYPPYGAAELGADKEQYRYYFMPRGGNTFDDWGEFIEFARVMTPNQLSPEEFSERIWEVADVEEILRILAIRLNTDDWDTWAADRGKNCYWYRPSSSGRWVLLAWDMELTYEDVNAFMPPRLTESSNPVYNMGKFQEARLFINDPRVKRMYYGILSEMLDRQFNSDFLTPFMAKLQAAGVTSTQHGRRNGYVDRRNAALRSRVSGVTSAAVDFAITTNGGNPIDSDAPVVTIEGIAPVEVFSIGVVVDGDVDNIFQADLSSLSLLGWSSTLALSTGTHTVEFVGFDSSQNPIAAAAIEVTVGAPTERFIRGDVDLDSRIAIADAVTTLLHISSGRAITCRDAADANDDGRVNITDAVFVLGYLFQSGAPPASPFPGAGTDPTADALDCERGLR